MANNFKLDSKGKTLWNLQDGMVYEILNSNRDLITIKHGGHVGLYNKHTESILIPACYDAIGGPFQRSIPSTLDYPFELQLGNLIGIGSKNGVVLEPMIDKNKYSVYAETFSEGIVAVEYATDALTMNPVLHFFDTKNKRDFRGFIL